MFSTRAVLFIDEIHRFSKAQQDSLLGAVERGSVTLIGATTENPSFEVIPALLSRSQAYVLEAFGKDHLQLVHRALDGTRGCKHRVEIAEWDALLRASGGDGRRCSMSSTVAAGAAPSRAGADGIRIDDALASRFIQANLSRYDKTGDTITTSPRPSSNPSAAATPTRLLAADDEGGEDPKFIARRLLISASEDIGHANPTALVLPTPPLTRRAVGLPGVPYPTLPVRDLPRVEPQVQQRLRGYRHGPEGRPGPRGPAGSDALAQRADQVDEGPRPREWVPLRPRSRRGFSGQECLPEKGSPDNGSSVRAMSPRVSGASPISCAACGATARDDALENSSMNATFLYPVCVFAAPSSKAMTQADIAQSVERRIRNA